VSGEFISDVKSIRLRARQHMERGAVTEGYEGNREVVLLLLNEALATELVCVLRYARQFCMAKGIDSHAVAAEFLEHADEEQSHAAQIATRIRQLGGVPDFGLNGLKARRYSEYVEGESLTEMIRENLVAEWIAIESYSEMVRYIGESDPATRSMLKGILAAEEGHADDMARLLATLDPIRKTA
jgi:bacterioferritin